MIVGRSWKYKFLIKTVILRYTTLIWCCSILYAHEENVDGTQAEKLFEKLTTIVVCRGFPLKICKTKMKLNYHPMTQHEVTRLMIPI